MPIEEKADHIRYRIEDPDKFVSDSFRTIELGDGIKAVIGKWKTDPQGSTHIQAYLFEKPKWSLEEAKKWAEEQKKKKNALKTIEGVEIFAAGTWNGESYTEAHIDEMIRAFQETCAYCRPPLKLGHDDNQALLQGDGLPAAGWIGNLYKEGGKLVADFVGIPEKIYDVLKNGLYRKVSSEVFFDIEINGEKYDRMLAAVALLGSDLPAVSCLSDIFDSYTRKIFAEKTCTKKRIDSTIDFKRGDFVMDEKEQADKISKLEALCAELKQQMASIMEKMAAKKEEKPEDKLEEKPEEYKIALSRIQELENKVKEVEIEKAITELTAQGLISPAMHPHVREFLSDKKVFSLDKKEVTKEAFLKNLFELHAEKLKINATESTITGARETDEKEAVEKIAEEKGISFKEAYKQAFKNRLKNR